MLLGILIGLLIGSVWTAIVNVRFAQQGSTPAALVYAGCFMLAITAAGGIVGNFLT